jgi:hypothetical protein
VARLRSWISGTPASTVPQKYGFRAGGRLAVPYQAARTFLISCRLGSPELHFILDEAVVQRIVKMAARLHVTIEILPVLGGAAPEPGRDLHDPRIPGFGR